MKVQTVVECQSKSEFSNSPQKARDVRSGLAFYGAKNLF